MEFWIACRFLSAWTAGPSVCVCALMRLCGEVWSRAVLAQTHIVLISSDGNIFEK